MARFTIFIPDELARGMDAERGSVSRSRWIRDVVEKALDGAGAGLPAAMVVDESTCHEDPPSAPSEPAPPVKARPLGSETRWPGYVRPFNPQPKDRP